MRIEIKDKRAVWKYTALITAIATFAATGVVGALMAVIPGMHWLIWLWGVSIALFIPLLIAPPCAYFVLSIVRMLQETIEKVDSQIRFDPLTGILNRNHFLDSVRGREASGVLMIADADHFKTINDTYGHAGGDEVLRILANTLKQSVGNQGIVGRLGGEEFGIFLPSTDLEKGQQVAANICQTMRQVQMIVEGRSIGITLSIGGTLHAATTAIGHS
ncbi:MAG: GGDEF domain-containing protein, partial [Marinomonas sp.]